MRILLVMEMIGDSDAMSRVRDQIRRVRDTRCTVMVVGETGTGKELVARAIHDTGSRARSGPFVAVNCGALPEALIESELFGHRKGAFTGATTDRKGLFEEADGGTLFLDEVNSLPASAQTKLLRVLQEKRVRPVGAPATREVAVDVRIVCATNRNLEAEVAAGRFRSDLYYRLAVYPLEIPPLRERREDIPPLVEYFVAAATAEYGKQIGGISPEAMARLTAFPWPGNVRELQNVIHRLVLDYDPPEIGVDALPAAVAATAVVRGAPARPLPLAAAE